MPAVRRSPLLVAFWKAHRFIYRVTGGRVGSRMAPGRQLLLTTTGRRSAQPRSVALTYIEDGGASIVVATNTGEDAHPAWWLNLLANPAADVLMGRKRSRVRATEVDEPERTRLYRRFIDEVDRGYAEYIERTERRIPVVALKPSE